MVLLNLWSKISANYCFDVSFESLITGWSSYSLRNNTSETNILIQFPRNQNNDKPTCSGFLCPFLPPARQFCLGTISLWHCLSRSVRQSHMLWCMKSHMIWGNILIHSLKVCQIWWKSCWQTKCLWALHRYDFLAARPSWWVAVWLWGEQQQGPECGNQLRPQVCQSGGPGRQTLWKHGHRTSQFYLENKISLKSWKHEKSQKASFSWQSLVCILYGFHTFRKSQPCFH